VHSDEADLALLKGAAQEAGKLAMTFFRQNPNAWAKAGGSPVTQADMEVDALLRVRLLAERPNYGWLSEETADDPARLKNDTIFAVDPIDGTRGFIEGDDRWCVSLAVVRNGRPAVAALYAPARGELYSAIDGGGAWRDDGTRLFVSERTSLSGGRVTGPRGWLKTDAIQRLGVESMQHVPSLAYRLTLVATARVDAAFASPRANDWDLAACDLLVHEAGGRLTDLEGEVPRYNREIPRHGVLAAANARLHPAFLAMLADVARERVAAGLPA
jgi:myo-inositol-1(or 4)-monophosphatase